ncbi:hypothetical protein FQA39_LY13161 [Lamprigera yunnana]|nr:hypothetical protein FQA39_LY13161 [Lamprigera yunnana]
MTTSISENSKDLHHLAESECHELAENSNFSSLSNTCMRLKPTNIRINIAANQERKIEFSAESVNPKLCAIRDFENNSSCDNFSTVGSTYSALDDWYYNINTDDLCTLTTHDDIFENAMLTPPITSTNIEELSSSVDTTDLNASIRSKEENVNNTFTFLKPVLSVLKRPPTRLKEKSTCLTSPDSSKKPLDSGSSILEIDDDAISLYSHCSISSSHSPPHTKTDKLNNNKCVVKEVDMHESLPKNAISKCIEWDHKTSLYWQDSTHNEDTSQRPPNKQKPYIPPQFKSLCYYYFSENKCKNKKCRWKHNIHDNIKSTIMRSDKSALYLYEYAHCRKRLFLPLISTFVNAFTNSSRVFQLLQMVGHVMDINEDLVLNVTIVMQGLMKCGFTLNKCVEEIMKIFVKKYATLPNILLTVIYDETHNLKDYWHLVQNLICNSLQINYSVIHDLISISNNLKDVELSVKIANNILMYDDIDLTRVNEVLFRSFVTFLKSEKCTREVNALLEKANISNININNALPADCRCSLERFVRPEVDSATLNKMNLQNFNSTFNVAGNTGVNNDVSNKISQYNVPKNCLFEDVSEGNFSDSYNFEGNAIICTEISNAINKTSSNQFSLYSKNMLSNVEMRRLNQIINEMNHNMLIEMYNTFKNTTLGVSFVLNFIGFVMKKKNILMFFKMINYLMEHLERELNLGCAGNENPILYLLVINIVAVFQYKSLYDKSAKLLSKFHGSLDKLVGVQWIRSLHRHNFSQAGKYLYLCNVFIRGNFFDEALTILKNPNLMLLYSISLWPLEHNEDYDNEFRNQVVNAFILSSLEKNLPITLDILLFMFTNKDIISELNLWDYFNDLILTMLNSERMYEKEILRILPNILQGWYIHLRKSNLRGLIIVLVSGKFPEEQLFALIRKCMVQNVYQRLYGNENNITIATDMTIEEIYVLIRFFLHLLEKRKQQIVDLSLLIRTPHHLNSEPRFFIRNDYQIKDTKLRILLVLSRCFPVAILAASVNETEILINTTQLSQCVKLYERMHKIPKPHQKRVINWQVV